MQSRASRAARGWIAGSFATAVAALSHGLADDGAPSPFAILVALVFAGLLSTFAIGRRPSLPRLTVIVAGSQLAFHLVFSWLTPGTASEPAHHGAASVLSPAVAHHGDDPAMWAAHALALLATLVFLRKAELALWSLLRDAVRVVTRQAPAIGPRPTVWRTVADVAPRHPSVRRFLAVLSGRGPPRAIGV